MLDVDVGTVTNEDREAYVSGTFNVVGCVSNMSAGVKCHVFGNIVTLTVHRPPIKFNMNNIERLLFISGLEYTMDFEWLIHNGDMFKAKRMELKIYRYKDMDKALTIINRLYMDRPEFNIKWYWDKETYRSYFG